MGEHLDDRTLWIGLAVVLACGFAGGLLLSYLRSGNERSPFKAGHRRGGAEASGGCVGPLLIFMGLAVVGVALLSDVSIPSAFGGRVVNFSLMHDRQMLLILGLGVAILGGVLRR